MSNQSKSQVFVATLLTIVILGGLTLFGLNNMPNNSGAITPLFRTVGSQAEGESAFIRTETPVAGDVQATPTLNPSPSPTLTRSPTRTFTRTPTPVSVVVSTQKRSFVYYQGPVTYVRADAFAPLALSSFPRPSNDNGRGLDWFPTTFQSRAVVDKFVPELTAMRIRWIVILQGMNDWDLVANDYLIDRLNAEGIVPVMRIDRQVGSMDYRRLGWIVARYRERGVRYFQIFNEPNADEEWGTEPPYTPERFVAFWITAAEVVAANGGFPGFAPMSGKRDLSDLAFFRAALQELKRTGRYDLINLIWVAVHNYGDLNAEGFYRYRLYADEIQKVFGAKLPIIATEGGLETTNALASVIAAMYRFVEREREPYLLAFAPWLIGNAVGGGHDPRWEGAAWFTGTLDQIHASAVAEQVRAY